MSTRILKGTPTCQRAGSPRIFIHLYLSFPRWTASYKMHLLSFFLQRNSLRYVSNYPYIFSKAFATYLPHFFAICSHFIHIHLRGNFMLYIRTYLHSFENNFMSHLHWKSNFCTTHSHFERQLHAKCSYFEKHFRAIFNIYAHLQSI